MYMRSSKLVDLVRGTLYSIHMYYPKSICRRHVQSNFKLDQIELELIISPLKLEFEIKNTQVK